MIETTATLEELIPTQYQGIGQIRFDSLLMDEDGYKIICNEPIPVIRYKGKYLIGDGHTRAFIHFAFGIRNLKIRILETDEDLKEYGCEGFNI